MNSRVYKNKNNNWEFRITWYENGKQRNKRGSRNETGSFKTKADAVKAMKAAEDKLFSNSHITDKTYAEVFEEYQQKIQHTKAPGTIRKQNSLWNNHLKSRFGHRLLSDVSLGEINDFLSEKYQVYSYQYTESFLKMFYLILGRARDNNYLSDEDYRRFCVNNHRIKMPKRDSDDLNEIKVFSKRELELLDNFFEGRNSEIPYLVGKYCGLRINEVFGLLWDDIDFADGSINVRRQMLYTNIISLKPPKTTNSIRKVYMPKILQDKLLEHKAKAAGFEESRAQKAFIIKDSKGVEHSSLNLVCTLPNGKIQTVNSMKYPSNLIKEQLGIDFKFHTLRHTYGTKLAEIGTPIHILCKLMGHSKVETTRRYYLGISDDAINELKSKIELL